MCVAEGSHTSPSATHPFEKVQPKPLHGLLSWSSAQISCFFRQQPLSMSKVKGEQSFCKDRIWEN